MADTYTNFADICTKFYDLSIDSDQVGKFIYKKTKLSNSQNILFVGSYFMVARALSRLGLSLQIVDYSQDMVEQGRLRLPELNIEQADLRALPYKNMFDAVVVAGRVFTHMFTQQDVLNALESIHQSLKNDGVAFIDNYEDTKIRKTSYFNAPITVSDSEVEIVRTSSTHIISEAPFIVNWCAEYEVKKNGQSDTYKDEMPHRAFSCAEMKSLAEENGFEVLETGDNFDETSFYITIKKVAK